MRRRSRKEPNTSEATGKTGREIPTNQPRPLSPLYGTDLGQPEVRPAVRPEPARPEPARLESRPEPARTEPRPDAPARRRRRPDRRPRQPIAASTPSPASPATPSSPARRIEVETQPESPLPGRTDSAAAPSQEPKGVVVLTIGLPGSGKTTWYRRRGVTPLSSDMLRTILFDDITEQRYQGLVFATLRSLLRARLVAKMPWNYVDATNLSAHERRQWIKMAQSFGYEVQAVYFDVPYEVCLERNAQRDRPVSEEAMQRMAEKLKAPDFEEGFTKITVVRVKSS